MTLRARQRKAAAVQANAAQAVPEHVQRRGDPTRLPAWTSALRQSGLVVQRQVDEEESAPIPTRAEEVESSKTSPGQTEQDSAGTRFVVMNFGIGESALKKEHQQFLDALYYGHLTIDPMATIRITGHADSTGSKATNTLLARKRAQSVAAHFNGLDKKIAPRILSTSGQGASAPIASNENIEGRARNRRVEVAVTPFKPAEPLEKVISSLGKDMAPIVLSIDGFASLPFQSTVKGIVQEAFKALPLVEFDWEGTASNYEAGVSIDTTTSWSKVLGVTGSVFLNSFKNNTICRVPSDPSTCEKVFPETADILGAALGNTLVHELAHEMGLQHVSAEGNFMWTPELHPVFLKKPKTFDDKVLLQRTLQAVPSTFTPSQLVFMLTRVKQRRKASKARPGVIEFE